ncbi:MAG: histidinol-phosphate transaminase [Candidatus Caldatribacterium sp.]|uniref:histidinol-phosphate transaminase n=1 Tax=Candidatus Caldatribacterium sp. TaxID=2282143 RepID=UPI0029979C1E|nr:histidinol-phosphate transaminase [Candidatus Caldatribacterium sp.]MCX7729615.1 histidinol-phosphate transaminase [Candidatus Caldatribacterium sp.]MDW8081385.1 histidinol-phosphate transaminase [Candidatus Calescibacterium sp.]
MVEFRKAISALQGYIPGEQPKEKGFIKLNTNENPYPPSPKVVTALCTFLASSSLALYPPPLSDAVRQKISSVYGVPEEWVLVGNGSDELLDLIVRVFVEKGSQVVYPVPTYTYYRVLTLLQEGTPCEIPFPEDFSLPKAFVTLPGHLKFLCNPNSPTGTFVPPEEVEDVLRVSSCPVVVDEAYVDFAPSSTLPLLERYENLIVVRTLSKSFSLAGLRIGFLFAHPYIIRELTKVKASYNVNILSQVGACAALDDCNHAWENIRRIKRTREWFSQRMRELGFFVYPSEANFVLIRKKGVDLFFLYEELKKRKILVRYFSEWPDALRISIGTDSDMELLCANMEDILKERSYV